VIATPERFLRTRSIRLWWPQRSAEIFPYLRRYPTVTVMQCSDAIASDLADLSFRTKPFHTSLLDLTSTEEQLWSGLSKKSCRYEINRARKTVHKIIVNERRGEARHLLNSFIERSRYRKPISIREWDDLLANCDVFVIEHDDEIVAAHVLLRDIPDRVRLLLSATTARTDPAQRSIVGALNRALHWEELLHYKGLGTQCFDFGGVDLAGDPALLSISRFKLSFGGPVVKENRLRLAGNAALRSALRGAIQARSAWRRGAGREG